LRQRQKRVETVWDNWIQTNGVKEFGPIPLLRWKFGGGR